MTPVVLSPENASSALSGADRGAYGCCTTLGPLLLRFLLASPKTMAELFHAKCETEAAQTAGPHSYLAGPETAAG